MPPREILKESPPLTLSIGSGSGSYLSRTNNAGGKRMEAYREALSTATAVITEDGTTLWCSPAWQNVIHSAHAWGRPGEAESALSLPEFLEQCHGPDQTPGPLAIAVENAHLDPRPLDSFPSPPARRQHGTQGRRAQT